MDTRGSRYEDDQKPRARKRSIISRLRTSWKRQNLTAAFGIVLFEAALVWISVISGRHAVWSPMICGSVLATALWLPRLAVNIVAITGGIAWSAADCWTDDALPAIIGAALRVAVVVAMARTCLEYRESIITERRLSETDYLTGAFNKRGFFRRAAEALRLNGKRKKVHPISIALIDLDDFKKVNDTLGHAAGDKALRATTHSIRRHLRRTDTLARIGGDEFLVLLPNVGRTEALALAERVRLRLNHDLRDAGLKVTGSVGLVTFENAPKSVRNLMERADWLMFEAKAAGKNAVRSDVVSSGKPSLM